MEQLTPGRARGDRGRLPHRARRDASSMSPMATPTVTPPDVSRIVGQLAAERDEIAAKVLRAVVPNHADRERFADLEQAAYRVFDLIVGGLGEGRHVTRDDVLFLRPHLRKAVLRGATEAQALAATHHLQLVLWDAILELAGETDGGRAAALALARPLMEYVEVASQVADEAFIEIHEALSSRASNVRFELLEDLLAGHEAGPGPKLNAARACGLDGATSCVVVVGRLVDRPKDEASLPLAATALARARGDAVEPLVVVRDDEIVIVRATAPDDAPVLADALDGVRRSLQADELRLAVAMSALHESLSEVPDAYREACLALESMGDAPGVVALPNLSALDYLILRAGDNAAWQLLPPAIRDFVEEDAAQGSLLIDTVLAYVETDLNVKLASERLHVHPNTAHYRLAKIEERTGCNLRRLDDLQPLVIAIRLAAGRARSPGEPPRAV